MAAPTFGCGDGVEFQRLDVEKDSGRWRASLPRLPWMSFFKE